MESGGIPPKGSMGEVALTPGSTYSMFFVKFSAH